AFLAQHSGGTASDLEPLIGGLWSSAWGLPSGRGRVGDPSVLAVAMPADVSVVTSALARARCEALQDELSDAAALVGAGDGPCGLVEGGVDARHGGFYRRAT